MVDTYSNYLKVILFPGDICEINAGISRNNCATVQHFNYESKRFRSVDNDMNYHAEEPSVLDFTIRLNAPDTGKQLLSQIQRLETFAYSFIFNATFNATNSLVSFDDAMVAHGNIIDIEEVLSTSKSDGQQEQMLMHVKVLLSAVTYIGKKDNRRLSVH